MAKEDIEKEWEEVEGRVKKVKRRLKERERERRKRIEKEGSDSAQCNSTRPLTSTGA